MSRCRAASRERAQLPRGRAVRRGLGPEPVPRVRERETERRAILAPQRGRERRGFGARMSGSRSVSRSKAPEAARAPPLRVRKRARRPGIPSSARADPAARGWIGRRDRPDRRPTPTPPCTKGRSWRSRRIANGLARRPPRDPSEVALRGGPRSGPRDPAVRSAKQQPRRNQRDPDRLAPRQRLGEKQIGEQRGDRRLGER